MDPIKPWGAACAQVLTTSVSPMASREEARHFMDTKLSSWEALIQNIAEAGDIQLVLFPEFPLTGSPGKENMAEWIDKACLALDGPEIERIRVWASRYKLFIGANAYCTLPEFPGRFFNTSFLIDPSGKMVLAANRIHTNLALSPHDMLEEFLDKKGIDGLFPVAKTALGNLALVTSTDLIWPEVPRAHVLRGAEVLLHPSSEPPAYKVAFEHVRRARAVENMAYVVSCNTGGYLPIAPGAEAGAPSRIFDHDGEVIAESPAGESTKCRAKIDVAAIRSRRGKPGGLNFLAGLRTETFRGVYDKKTVYPFNTWNKAATDFRAISPKRMEQALQNMRRLGLLND